ncbi:RHS repeat-associated core domain-containing protein [Hyphobacterium sp.]|uniref:RHS repeat-associated core domain-containing protein n=1 Tax=Hyphobacterium sp. TaxID=2004662 RepID=UPI003BAB8530
MDYDGVGTSLRVWYLTDERGSVMARTNDSGNVFGVNRYDEYGNEPALANSGTFGYAGMVRLDFGTLTHNRNRAYHPGFGRFLQMDPIGQAGGLNVYAYVGGDPVNYVDPLGLSAEEGPRDRILVTTTPPDPCTLHGAICGDDYLQQFRDTFAEDLRNWALRGLAIASAKIGSFVRASALEAICRPQSGVGSPFRRSHGGRNRNYYTPEGAISDAAHGAASRRGLGTARGGISTSGDDRENRLASGYMNIAQAAFVRERVGPAFTTYHAGPATDYGGNSSLNDGGFGNRYAIVVAAGPNSNRFWRLAAQNAGVDRAYQALGGRVFQLRFWRTEDGRRYYC